MSASKLSKNHHYGCIGRDKKQKEVIQVWQEGNKRIFNCHGGKESGKSCFIRNCLDNVIEKKSSDSIVIDTDFKRDRIGPKDSRKFWTYLAKHLARVKVVIEITHPMTEETLENFFEEIKERKIIFLLDNLDYARNAKADDKSSKTEKDLFSELQDNFIPGIVERTDMSMVFITSTVQLRYGQIAPTVHKIEIDPLSTESAGDLLLKTIELTSDMDKEAARTHLGPYLEPISLLSEGIPMAVIVTGSQLTDNNFSIKPKDMLTILIYSRMYSLSPELFPKEDNMIQTYVEYIEKQSSGRKERLQEMDGKASFKSQTVTPLPLLSFVKHVGNSDKSETLEMPGFLREFIIIEKIIDSSKGLAVEDRLACRKVTSHCLHRLGRDLNEQELRRIIENTNEYDEFVEQTLSSPTPEEDRFMDTQKDMGKNDLGKPFIGYSHKSLLGRIHESNLSDFPEQRMQNLKPSEKDADQDSHSSLNPGTPNEEIQGEQTQDYILPGQLAEQVSMFNYNVSDMPPSMERSPQSIAHAGFIYQENDIFKCQYCEAQIHRSHLSGNMDIMQKHRMIDPRCPFVRQDQEYRGQNYSQQVKDMGAWNERREFLQLGVTENGQETNGMDTKNNKFDNSSNLSSSYGDKQYPHNKMAPSVMEDHTGPKEAENGVGFSPRSSRETKYVRGQCTKQTDENGAVGNDLHEIGDKQYPQNKMDSLENQHTSPKGGKDLVVFKFPDYEPFLSTLFMEKNYKRSKDEGYVSPYNSDSDDPPDHMVGYGSPHTSDNDPTDPMAMKDQESSKPQHEPQKEKDVDYDADASSKKGTTHGKLLTEQPQCFLISGAQSIIERQQDFKADVYTLSWSCYPRVEVLMQQLNSISERFRKLVDRYHTFRQNLTQQRQFLPTRVTIVDMKRDPQILVIGDLRGEFTMRNIACNTDKFKDDLPFKTTTLRNWTRYYHCPEDPAVVVFIVWIVTEDDFSRCLNNLNHILGQPYHVIGVIEMGPHINRQSEQYIHFNSVVARYNEQCWNQEVKVQTFSVILDDQLVKEKVPGKISECFELEVVTSLSLIEESLKKNIRDEDFISLVKFEQAGFIKNINDAVMSLFTCDDRVADAVWDRFQKSSMTLQALKEIITEVHLQAIRKGMVNELSRSTGIMPEIMERLVDQADFEPLCKASIKDSTVSILLESFLPAMTGYSCEHLRNPEERKRFWKLIETRDHSKYSDILIDDLIIVIENTARKIILKELEKNLAIQKKLHFEVVSLLKRTIVKDKFEHLLPAGELPSDDLFGIEEVEGIGILYNKLHIHIKLKNPEDEVMVSEQIRAKLCNYHHPYRIVVIADSKASVCVGESLYTFYQIE